MSNAPSLKGLQGDLLSKQASMLRASREGVGRRARVKITLGRRSQGVLREVCAYSRLNDRRGVLRRKVRSPLSRCYAMGCLVSGHERSESTDSTTRVNPTVCRNTAL